MQQCRHVGISCVSHVFVCDPVIKLGMHNLIISLTIECSSEVGYSIMISNFTAIVC